MANGQPRRPYQHLAHDRRRRHDRAREGRRRSSREPHRPHVARSREIPPTPLPITSTFPPTDLSRPLPKPPPLRLIHRPPPPTPNDDDPRPRPPTRRRPPRLDPSRNAAPHHLQHLRLHDELRQFPDVLRGDVELGLVDDFLVRLAADLPAVLHRDVLWACGGCGVVSGCVCYRVGDAVAG